MLIGFTSIRLCNLKSSWHSSWINWIIWLSVWCRMANIVLGAVVDKFGWDVGFILLTAISVFAMLSPYPHLE